MKAKSEGTRCSFAMQSVLYILHVVIVYVMNVEFYSILYMLHCTIIIFEMEFNSHESFLFLGHQSPCM